MNNLNKLKEDGAFITKGIEQLSKKLELSDPERCESFDSIEGLQQFLVEVKTLDEEIKSLLDVTRGDINHQKHLLKESKISTNEIEKEIASLEKMYDVSVLDEGDEPQVTTSVETVCNEDASKSSIEATEGDCQNDDSGNNLDVYDLLNKSFPKLL